MSSLQEMLRKWLGHEQPVEQREDAAATFILKYEDLPVGTLTLDHGEWTFQYSDEFKARTDLRPIVQFPDVTRTYRSRHLWPFFALRIPSLEQMAVREIVEAEEIDITDEVELLRRFGRHTLANPFELEEA